MDVIEGSLFGINASTESGCLKIGIPDGSTLTGIA
jgi:hypothetical protein